jgi:hypothetical protein
MISVSKEKSILILALVIIVLLRLPSLVDPMYYLDEGVYSSVAYEIGQGGTLYKTAWDLKPPGIFYVYLSFQTLFGSQAFLMQRFFDLLLGMLAVLGAYKLAKQLGLRDLSLCFAAILTAIFLGLPFFEGHIFNTENIFLVTSLWGIVLGLRYQSNVRERFLLSTFISGYLFGVGQWLKIHPIFDLAAFGLFALVKFKLDKKFWRPFIAGVLTPLVGLVLFLAKNGILREFWQTNFSYNLFYVNELPQITIFGGLMMRTLLLLLAALGLTVLKFKNKISEQSFLLLLWFFFTLYGALLSARAYNHYFIPVLTPTALLIATTSHRLRSDLQKIAVAALTILPFVGFLLLQSPYRIETFRQRIIGEQLDFYKLRLGHMSGKVPRRDFENHFTPKPWRLRELKSYLDENVAQDESVYLWGNSPWAPYILKRRPAQRYLMWFHVLGVGDREQEVLRDLLASPPDVIVVEEPNSRPPFEKLQRLIDTNYQFKTNVADYEVYKKFNGTRSASLRVPRVISRGVRTVELFTQGKEVRDSTRDSLTSCRGFSRCPAQ